MRPERPRGGNPAVSPALDRVVARCLAKNPRTALLPAMSCLCAISLGARERQSALQQSKDDPGGRDQRAHKTSWLMAAAFPVAGVELSVIRSFRAGLVVPPPPEAVRSAGQCALMP